MDKNFGMVIICTAFSLLCFIGTASATTWSVDGRGGSDFTGIQDAINNASDEDTILVHSGIYYENVVADKSVTLKGKGQAVVDANGSDSAITLTADGITLVGFNATNSGSSRSDVGIKVTSNNNTITGNNVCSNNWYGIHLDDSSNNTITGNNVSNNYDFFNLWYYSSNNIFYRNNFINNTNNFSDWEGKTEEIDEENVKEGILGVLEAVKEAFKEVQESLGFSHGNRGSTNTWNSTEKITYTYNGSTYTNYLGNYWSDYPTNLTVGDDGKVILGIVNHEYTNVTYQLEVRLSGEPIGGNRIELKHNETWESPFTFRVTKAGRQKLEFLLFKDGLKEPYRDLHLWVDVK